MIRTFAFASYLLRGDDPASLATPKVAKATGGWWRDSSEVVTLSAKVLMKS
jgi:hypothetical protein